MPQPNKIPLAFAASGDKNTIPESTETTGLASWRDGFPAITSAPFSEGGIAPKRADFNGIFNALSLATLWQQQGGFYEYDATTDYEVGNVVEYNNDLYKCLSANGPSSAVKAPTDTTVWDKVMTAADVAALYLPNSTITTGTWTPTLYGETVTGSLTYSANSGAYLKIGHLVYIKATVTVSGYSTHPTGRAFLGGLPFTINPPVVNLILRGGYGQNNSFDKLLRAATNGSGTAVVLTGINESSNIFGDIVFSSSSTSGTNIQFSSSGSIRGSVVISGAYWSS